MAVEFEALFVTDTPTLGYGKYAGVYKVASELRRSGFRSLVVDCFNHFSNSELKTLLDLAISDKTKILGFSSTFLMSRFKANGSFIPRKFTPFTRQDHIRPLGRPDQEIHDFISYARELNPQIKILIGGAAVSRNRRIFSHFDVDYLFEREADVAIVRVLESLIQGKDGQIKSLPLSEGGRQRLITPSEYPYHDFSESCLIWRDEDIIFKDEALPIEIARGCIFRCKFCDYNMNGKRPNDYTRSEESLVKEMKNNFDRFGITKYLITDDLLNESPQKMEMLARVRERLGFDIEWSAYARLDMIWKYPEMIRQIQDLGGKYLLFGIETLHDKAGLAVGKGLGKRRVLETLEKCFASWGRDVIMATGLIIGLPHEPIGSVEETYRWLIEKDCPISKATFTAYILESSFTDRSEISQDHAKFGYSLYQKNGITFWKNDHMTQEDAQRLMFEFNNSGSERFSYMESGFFHRFANLNSSLDFLGKRDAKIEDFHVARRDQYKYELLTYLSPSIPRSIYDCNGNETKTQNGCSLGQSDN